MQKLLLWTVIHKVSSKSRIFDLVLTIIKSVFETFNDNLLSAILWMTFSISSATWFTALRFARRFRHLRIVSKYWWACMLEHKRQIIDVNQEKSGPKHELWGTTTLIALILEPTLFNTHYHTLLTTASSTVWPPRQHCMINCDVMWDQQCWSISLQPNPTSEIFFTDAKSWDVWEV